MDREKLRKLRNRPTVDIYELIDAILAPDPEPITPKPGEVWAHMMDQAKPYYCWIFRDQGKLLRVWDNGIIEDVKANMIHNQGGWKRIFPEVK